MEFSFLKALSASVRGQLSSLKSQSKRLHSVSHEVFGVDYSLDVCRQAVASANGYRNWSEILRLDSFTGLDKNRPQWLIQNRTEIHEACLKALFETDCDVYQSKLVAVAGEINDSALYATCLWAEYASAGKNPGLVLIDTTERTFQKTSVGKAAKRLGLADMFQGFRVIDTRSDLISNYLTASPANWRKAIEDACSIEDVSILAKSKALVRLERLIHLFNWADRSSFKEGDDPKEVPWDIVCKASLYINSPGQLEFHLDGVKDILFSAGIDVEDDSKPAPFWYISLRKNLKIHYDSGLLEYLDGDLQVQSELAWKRVFDFIQSVSLPANGICLAHESLHRPVVVLFDSTNTQSLCIASALSKIRINRPALYCGEQAAQSLPRMLRYVDSLIYFTAETDPRADVWKTFRPPSLFIEAQNDGIVVSGKFAEGATC